MAPLEHELAQAIGGADIPDEARARAINDLSDGSFAATHINTQPTNLFRLRH